MISTDGFKHRLLHNCIFFFLLFLCSRFIEHENHYDSDCEHASSNGSIQRACSYRVYHFDPVTMFIVHLTNQNSTELSFGGEKLFDEIFVGFGVLLVYLLPIAAYHDAVQTRKIHSYIGRRLTRLVMPLLIGFAIFILPIRVFPKLRDYGVTMRYLYSDGTFDMFYIGFALSLPLYELFLLSIFFYGTTIVNVIKKLVQWSSKYLAVVLFEFVMLSMIGDCFLRFIEMRGNYSQITLLHFGFMIYFLQANQHLKSKAEEHTLSIGSCMLCAVFLLSLNAHHNFSWSNSVLDSFKDFLYISACYLLVLFLFSLFSNFLQRKYTVKTSNDDGTNKSLLTETVWNNLLVHTYLTWKMKNFAEWIAAHVSHWNISVGWRPKLALLNF